MSPYPTTALLLLMACGPATVSDAGPSETDGSDGSTFDGSDGADAADGSDGSDASDGTDDCTEPGLMAATATTADLEHWAGAAPAVATLDLTVERPACDRFVAQGHPSWLVPTLSADAETLSISVDPDATVESGLHTGFVTVRDADDPAVLVEVEVTVRAWASPAGGGAPKVLVVGIDGLDGDELSRIDAPNLDRLKPGGLWTLDAHTQLEAATSSGPGWTSILTGVDSNKHNITSNGGYGARDTAWPSFSWRARTTRGLRTAASIQWTPIYEIFEDDANDVTASGSMTEVGDQMAGLLRSGLYDVHFVHLDDVDGAGHSTGFSADSATYAAEVARADAIVGQLADAVLQRPEIASEDWLIVVTSDHGGSGSSHGCMSPDCQTIPLFVAGTTMPVGELPAGEASHMDVHATVIDFLGIDPDGLDLDGVSWLSHELDCSDGLDDDGDGRIDCDDADCADTEACWTCPQDDLGGAVGVDLWTGQADAGGYIEGTCGGAGFEVPLQWTAPAAGWYSFDTTGIYDDTVLYVLDGDCDGAELACNDNIAGVRSAVAVELDAGQPVVAVIDAANAGEAIDVTLSAYPFDLTCPHGDLGTATGAFSGTLPMTDTAWLGGSCPPAVGGAQHTWTAPDTATYTFSTAGSSFDTVLYVTTGCDGADANLACNDDSGGLQSAATVALTAGDAVVVTIGAFDARFGTGAYTLTISD